jgi:signal transduction histidine kinase
VFVDPPLARPAFWPALESLAKGVVCTLCWLLARVVVAHADPIPLKSVEASFQGGDAAALAKVIDGVEASPEGWSVGPKFSEPQSLIVRCAKPVVANELDISLFFLSGQPGASIAEFELAYTTDDEPSLKGNWQPLGIQLQSADYAMLDAVPGWRRMRASIGTTNENRVTQGDIYRLGAQLPGGRASGFRLQVFPLLDKMGKGYAMGWSPHHDFVLTEFRVEEHLRATTNMALNCPVRSSHPVQETTSPGALTDGLPSTYTHPASGNLGAGFHFDIDLGRSAALDHINLRGRGDIWKADRLSRVMVRLYENNPELGAKPVWAGIDRADGSFPAPGEHDVIHAGLGKGDFRGRYLRLSSDSPVLYSPQLAEVEVYESRTPELVSVLADGRKIPANGELNLPFEDQRLSIQLKIPQTGMPAGDLFRWRIRGGSEEWQTSRMLTIDMPCPPRGQTFFEAQALHSDREWDTTVFSLPIIRKRLWETSGFQAIAAVVTLLGAMSLTRFVTKRRAARQLALVNSRAVLAEERMRIARDLHDDIGAGLTQVVLLSDMARRENVDPERAKAHQEQVVTVTRRLARSLDEIVWAINPTNDALEDSLSFVCKFAQDFLRAADISCRLNWPEDLSGGLLSSSQRHQLYLAVREVLNNVVKHAAATEVWLRLEVSHSNLILEIRDNGRGFVVPLPGARSSRHGLNGMAERMNAVGGGIEITSETGHGTMIRLRMPIHGAEFPH